MIRKDIKSKIKNYFLLNPTKRLRVRQIEKYAMVPLPSAIRYAKELEKEGILKSEEIAKIKLYSADRSSRAFFLEKRIFNIRMLYASGLVDRLEKEYANPTILLFGSYHRGEDIESSDIDIYLESPSDKEVQLAAYESKLKRKIQLFLAKDINGIKGNELKNNIVNGTVLNGFLEVF
jgi:predicted nucleotidyltransferase